MKTVTMPTIGKLKACIASKKDRDSYQKTIMAFIGVQMMDSVMAEGMAYAPDNIQP